MIASVRNFRLTPLSNGVVFFLSLIHFSAAAELRGVTEPKDKPVTKENPVRRFEVLTGKSYAETAEQLQPSRVYVVRSQRLEKWIFVTTNQYGKIPLPLEALAPGSVVKGSAVGGDSDKRYRLTGKARWVVSKEPLQRRVWSITSAPNYEVYVPLAPRRKPASKSKK